MNAPRNHTKLFMVSDDFPPTLSATSEPEWSLVQTSTVTQKDSVSVIFSMDYTAWIYINKYCILNYPNCVQIFWMPGMIKKKIRKLFILYNHLENTIEGNK